MREVERRIAPVSGQQPAIVRLSAVADLDDAAKALLSDAASRSQRIKAKRDLVVEGQPVTGPMLILEGWAVRLRILPDGRRQVISFLLPGDLIGVCDHERPLAISTVNAITNIAMCTVPSPFEAAQLKNAYAVGRAYEEAYLLAQITRLGRMTAYERIADLLLELRDRLGLAGLVQPDGRFGVPLTQEVLADSTGLTAVHVNRTLQLLRREGAVAWKGGEVFVADPVRLAEQVGHVSPRPCARL